MSNLFKLADDMIDADVSRLGAMGVFALVRGMKRVSTANGNGMFVEDTKTLKLSAESDNYINPAIENRINPNVDNPPMPSEEFDMLAVDGFPGSNERIEQLAAFYAVNNSVEDRRGNQLKDGISPCVLTESESAERLIEASKQWADIPASKRTEWQTAIMAIVAAELGS